MRQLLADLRALGAAATEELASAQQQKLHQRIGENAATVMAVCQNGLAAVGHLLAHSAPVIEDGTVGADSVEALGWLMAEVGDLAAVCLTLATSQQDNKGSAPPRSEPGHGAHAVEMPTSAADLAPVDSLQLPDSCAASATSGPSTLA